MSAKAVREYHGKRLLARHISALSAAHAVESRSALVTSQTNLDALPETEPWLLTTPLVVKPDQLIKRRGKAGLVGINLSYSEVRSWIEQRMDQEITIENTVTGRLNHFIVEPFIPHNQSDEHYVCIQSSREGDVMLFCRDGGVDVGDVDAKAKVLEVAIDQDLTEDAIRERNLVEGVPEERKDKLCGFLAVLFEAYRKLHFVSAAAFAFVLVLAQIYLCLCLGSLAWFPFYILTLHLSANLYIRTLHPPCFLHSYIASIYQPVWFHAKTYLEINPIVFTSTGSVVPLDLAAKIDETAAFLCQTDWGHLDFPAPFGRLEYPEEAYIRELDSKTGASLKLTILNHAGRVWTMVAGGGASVVYADTIADSGFGHELANYGEYSGAPSTEHTFEYAKVRF